MVIEERDYFLSLFFLYIVQDYFYFIRVKIYTVLFASTNQ